MGISRRVTSPVAFLQRPARWMQLLASNSHAFSAAPNFAFDLAARKTSDDDMAGLDLGGVLSILNGSERVQPATLQALRRAVRPLQPPRSGAAALVWTGGSNGVRGDPRIGSTTRNRSISNPRTVRRPREAVRKRGRDTAGQLRRAAVAAVRIVDPETSIECPGGNGR